MSSVNSYPILPVWSLNLGVASNWLLFSSSSLILLLASGLYPAVHFSGRRF